MKKKNQPVEQDTRKNLPADAKHLIANARNDITIPFYSGALQHVDDTLIQRGQGKGLKLYDEIERDTHAYAMLEKRKKQLVAREWEIAAASDLPLDVQAADFIREQLKSLPFDRISEELAGGATLKGFAVSEVVWQRDGNRIVPAQIVSHDQRRFAFDEDWCPKLLTWTNMRDGDALPERKFIVHRFGVIGNNPYGFGLGTRLFWAVLFKREGVAFWLHFLDKFAGPTIIASTPYGTLSDEQRKLLLTLAGARTASAITVPIGTDVKFLEAARSGAVSYQEWMAYWDKQISICVTGETLTTDIGSTGSRAAAEVHADMLDMLVDSDADLLSDTFREQLLAWMVDYNFPGAGVPSVWRVRPSNEQAKAGVRKAKAEAAIAENDALINIIITAAQIDDDADAREYITSFGLTDHLSDQTIDRLVEARVSFMENGRREKSASDNTPLFSAALKKKDLEQLELRHVCFAQTPDTVTDLTLELEARSARISNARLDAIRNVIDTVPDLITAAQDLLTLGATWSPAPLGNLLADALELAALAGREAVFSEAEGNLEADSFAEPEVFNQPFKEQIAYFRQKRIKPTRSWTDVLRGNHDRSFVIAGATDLAMLSDFQNVLAKAMEQGTTLEDFRDEFDRIVEEYGWEYKGKRGWRTRVIYETNMRTSYMAGRLKQMRDPDVLKLRPYWEYRHGETRTPRNPRPQHLAWHGLVLRHDDPFWETHYPPNDFLCSCGVRTLSQGDLKRLGKDGPDEAPGELFQAFSDPLTGRLIENPQGVGYGWDYQPGALWEQGLVPSSLMDAGSVVLDNPRMAVAIDTPEPMADLIANAKPLKAKALKEGLTAEDYVSAFLKPFGAAIGRAVLFEDKAGMKVPVSDQLFRDAKGKLKVLKRDRSTITPLLAEALMDPDEIWMGVARKADPNNPKSDELIIDRRYIRADPLNGLMIVFQIGERFWDAITAYNTTTKAGKPDLKALDKRRGGKLLYKRPKE